MHVPVGGFEQAAKAPGGDGRWSPPGHLFQSVAPRVHGCMQTSQQWMRRWRPRHTVGRPRNTRVTTPGREVKAIIMGSVLSRERTGFPRVPAILWTPDACFLCCGRALTLDSSPAHVSC